MAVAKHQAVYALYGVLNSRGVCHKTRHPNPPRSPCRFPASGMPPTFGDAQASENDRFVALELLKNANIASGMVLPGCQDTGTAIIMGKRGQVLPLCCVCKYSQKYRLQR